MSILENIAKNAGYVITICTLLAVVIKPIRKSIISYFKKEKQDETQQEDIRTLLMEVREIKSELSKQHETDNLLKDAIKCSLRNTITLMYYKYMKLGELPEFERANLEYSYKAYKSLKGNSYVEGCYEALKELPIKL